MCPCDRRSRRTGGRRARRADPQRHRLAPQHRLAARGGTTDGGDLWDTLARLDRDGCARYVVTDVGRDGTLDGPNVELVCDVAEATPAPVIASGGVARIADLVTLARAAADGANIEGAIVGKALYAARFTLPEALAAVRDLGVDLRELRDSSTSAGSAGRAR